MSGLLELVVAEIQDDPDARRKLVDALREDLVEATPGDKAPLLTPTQVAQRLGVSSRTVNRWAAEGRLAAAKVGRGWRFHPDDLDLVPLRRPSAADSRRPEHAGKARRREPRHSGATAAMLDLARNRT